MSSGDTVGNRVNANVISSLGFFTFNNLNLGFAFDGNNFLQRGIGFDGRDQDNLPWRLFFFIIMGN